MTKRKNRCECGNPECNGPLAHGAVDQDIAAYGRSLISVQSDGGGHIAFAYSIGNWEEHKLPELLMVAPEEQDDVGILNAASEFMIRKLGRPFHNGETVLVSPDDAELCTLYVVHHTDCSALIDYVKDNYTCQATFRYGRDYPVMLVELVKDIDRSQVRASNDTVDWTRTLH